MNRTSISGLGVWGALVLLLGLLLSSCEPAGPTGTREVTPGENLQEEEVVAPDDQEEVAEPDDQEEVAEPDDQEEVAEPDDQEEVAEPDDQEEVAEPDDQEETLATLPAECLAVDLATKTITDFYYMNEDCKLKEFAIPGEVPAANPNDDPITITVIGATAFADNGLTKLSIPNSVITIGADAFYNNELTSLTIGNKVETIGKQAFYDNNITSLIIPNSVKTIGVGTFRNNDITSLTIGNKVETIRELAFAENNSLTSVTIPNSVTTIEKFAFYSNPNLVTVILDPHAMLTFVSTSFPFVSISLPNGDLWTAYSTGANKDKPGTWTYDGSAWSFTPK